MSDWSNGYPTHSTYIDAIQPALAPHRWQQALWFGGLDGPDPNTSFRFLDLGCGTATTLIALAAAHPQAQFTGVDFMPEAVQQARALIEACGLDNVDVIESSFADLATSGPGARYDYAAAHGVWTWVPDTVRAQMVQLLSRWMAPGGVVYLGYNTAAGWAAAAPVRHIFKTAAKGPDGNPYGPARDGVTKWLELYGDRHPQVRAHWATLKDNSDDFISHELGNPHGTGLWLEDVARALDGAKLTYAGPSVMAEHMDGPFLGEKSLACVRDAVAEGWGETARDLMHQRYFRKDLYHRGAPPLGGAGTVARLADLRVMPWSLEPRMATHLGVFRRLRHPLPEDLTERLQRVAEARDARLGDCMDALSSNRAQSFSAAVLALAAGDLIDLRAPAVIAAAQDGCDRFNTEMLRRARAGEPVVGLVSPVTGTCLQFPEETHRAVLSGKSRDAAFEARLARLGIELRAADG